MTNTTTSKTVTSQRCRDLMLNLQQFANNELLVIENPSNGFKENCLRDLVSGLNYYAGEIEEVLEK